MSKDSVVWWAFRLILMIAACWAGVKPTAVNLAAAGESATDQGATEASSAPASRIQALPGFQVDLVYAVPRESQGSWVNMTVDPRGRLIVSDQYGKLYRVTVPPLGAKLGDVQVEPITAEIGEAQGLLWAFESLYVVVNRGKQYQSGLYRVRDSDGDDHLDTVELLRRLEGQGEHGPHAVILAPDGKSLFLVAGNATRVPRLEKSAVPRIWGEDTLLPYMVDASGFMTGERAPGGYICRVSPDGQTWELFATGFRNPFDLAFNRDGELFTYDSDMEWDVNTPWYRPTRVLHVVSGGEYGYRNGSGKWPPYYLDSLPAVVDIGPGSPTGITFAYESRFPRKYREALYLCDWSYGKLYALHLKPSGATYTGEVEEFLKGTPLALTDVVINPADGAMYFTVGGRQTQSGLYRLTYQGPSDPPIEPEPHATDLAATQAREVRRSLERYHGQQDEVAADAAWPYLGHSDRFVRWAARIAIEHQCPPQWQERALSESSSTNSILGALLALTRRSAADPNHRPADAPPPDPLLRDRILQRLQAIDAAMLSHQERLDLVRVYQVVLNRFGRPQGNLADSLIQRLGTLYPTSSSDLNIEICQVLVFLQDPTVAARTIPLLEAAPTQEEQIDYARTLRLLEQGWTPALRKAYFSWFRRAKRYSGGNSFRGFMNNIQQDALARVSDAEKPQLLALLEAEPHDSNRSNPLEERPFVRAWTLDDLLPALARMTQPRNLERGRACFAAARCFSCHRFQNEGGGLGPDLTGVAGRFSPRDLLESIVDPNRTISDQYQAVMIATRDGRVTTGRIVNLSENVLYVSTDMLEPGRLVAVPRNEIEEIQPSPVSMMPEGLLNTFTEDEVLDLMAYLMSGGHREPSGNPMEAHSPSTSERSIEPASEPGRDSETKLQTEEPSPPPASGR
jgi:putative heme-binding domain-containing protein